MKTIVLVVPPLTSKERYGQFHRIMRWGIIRPPLGLLTIGAVLKKAGHSVHLIDALAFQLNSEETANRIMQLSPQVVGFSAYSMSIFSAAKLAHLVKARDNHVLTIIGGPHLTAVPRETMERFKSFDIGIIGEGEKTVVELMGASNTTECKNISGLIIRGGEGLYITERRPFIEDLDGLPLPAWELLHGFPQKYPMKRIRYKQYPVGDFCTSRGCPYQCTFCDKAVFGSRYRMFSAEYVIEAIERLRKLYNIRELMFKDDLMMFNKERLIEICEGLIKKKWGLTWTCMGRVDCIDFEVARLMKKAGCWQISYGIESGNQKLLDAVHKSISLDKVEQALYITKKAGLSPRGFFILGLPFETEQTIRKTINFAKRIPLDDINVALLTPFPGTRLYTNSSRYGTFDNDWRNMNKLQAVFVPSGLSKEILEKYLKCFYKEFFVRPSFLFKNIWAVFVSLVKN